VGFVATDRGFLVISIFCEDLPDEHVGAQVIGDMTRAALNATGIVELPESS
jgi:hypothetical protein